ncbi:MAG: hypothetical protein ACK5LV_02985 [Lachnospirales bacterium]
MRKTYCCTWVIVFVISMFLTSCDNISSIGNSEKDVASGALSEVSNDYKYDDYKVDFYKIDYFRELYIYNRSVSVGNVDYFWTVDTVVRLEDDYKLTYYDHNEGTLIEEEEFYKKYVNFDKDAEKYYIEVDGDILCLIPGYTQSSDNVMGAESPLDMEFAYKYDEKIERDVFYSWELSTYYYLIDDKIYLLDKESGEYVIYDYYMRENGFDYDDAEDTYFYIDENSGLKVFYNINNREFYFYSESGNKYTYDKYLDMYFYYDENYESYIYYDIDTNTNMIYNYSRLEFSFIENEDIIVLSDTIGNETEVDDEENLEELSDEMTIDEEVENLE